MLQKNTVTAPRGGLNIKLFGTEVRGIGIQDEETGGKN